MNKIGIIGKDVSLEVMFNEVLTCEAPPMKSGLFIGFDEHGEARMWTTALLNTEILFLIRSLNIKVEHEIFRGK